MFSSAFLANANAWSGVTMAVLGAVLVAPDGARRSLDWFRRRLQHLSVRAELWRFRVHEFVAVHLLHRARHYVGSTDAVATVDSAATGVRGPAVDVSQEPPARTLTQRVGRLEQKVEALDDRVDDLARDVTEESRERSAADSAVRRELEQAVGDLKSAQREQGAQAARIDAGGLPLIIWGIFLSGVPQQLAHWVIVGWIVLVTGVGHALWTLFRQRALLRSVVVGRNLGHDLHVT